MKIRISDLLYDSIVDGPGLRAVLFVQGCSHHCPGCHNVKTWDPNKGLEKNVDELIESILSGLKQHGISGFTFSGGEPFEQPQACTLIAKALKEEKMNLWAYSGYTLEEIMEDPNKVEFLKELDVLVDSKFILEKKSLALRFKGSANQRIIDVQRSLKEKKVILYHLPPKLSSYSKLEGIYI